MALDVRDRAPRWCEATCPICQQRKLNAFPTWNKHRQRERELARFEPERVCSDGNGQVRQARVRQVNRGEQVQVAQSR